MSDATSDVQLIGIGNVDRQDDGVGQRVVQRLADRHPDWSVLHVRQLVPELVDCIGNARLTVFVDGAVDVAVGDVEVRRIQVDGQRFHCGVTSHQFDPAQLLALVQWVELSRKEAVAEGVPSRSAWCVKIGIERIEFGELISASALSAMDRAVEEIEALVCCGS